MSCHTHLGVESSFAKGNLAKGKGVKEEDSLANSLAKGEPEDCRPLSPWREWKRSAAHSTEPTGELCSKMCADGLHWRREVYVRFAHLVQQMGHSHAQGISASGHAPQWANSSSGAACKKRQLPVAEGVEQCERPCCRAFFDASCTQGLPNVWNMFPWHGASTDPAYASSTPLSMSSTVIAKCGTR
jgi:hypothetical protein